MKIALINGSPKIKDSASEGILQDLKTFLQVDNNIISEYCFRKSQLGTKDIEQLIENEVLVFAFPLYVDGIPSHLLNCLVQLESCFSQQKEKEVKVYVLVNCGFHEGKQNELAIEIMENWCKKSGLKWGQGVGIGAGGMIGSLKNVPIGKGPKKNLGNAFNKLSSNILKGTSEENLFITANFPRILYKLAAEMGWRQSVKANGLKRKDLFLRK
jgi:multimeric flavodoxin WrbA